jgi:Undecaprenyl-phosphate galactose phosphotransferase WbaP
MTLESNLYEDHKAKRVAFQHGRLMRRCLQVRRQWLVTLAAIFSDILLALLVWIGAYVLQSIWGKGPLSTVAMVTVIPIVAVWIGLRWLMGLYPGYGLNPAERLRRHTYSVFGALAILAVFATAFQIGILLSRLLLALGFTGLLFVAPLVHSSVRWGMWRLGLWGRPVVVIGYKDTSTQTVKLLKEEWKLGFEPFAVLDQGISPSGKEFKITSPDEVMTGAEDGARNGGVDTVIFAMPYTRRDELAPYVSRASFSFQHVLVIPNLAGITNSAVTALDFAGTFAVEIKHNLLNPWALRTKRTLDLLSAVVGGLLISPILVTIALLIRLDSPGPIFYGHRRLGVGGKHFCCWKFRTMHPRAEQLLESYLRNNPNLRAEWEHAQKLRDDPRITRIGRFLRKSSLDELPQLWNVLRGEMSLVGSRPIVDAEVPKYGEVYEQYRRIRPGISGLWQVSGRSNTSYSERVAMDSYYVRNWSFWLDLILLSRTVKIVLRGRGAR